MAPRILSRAPGLLALASLLALLLAGCAGTPTPPTDPSGTPASPSAPTAPEPVPRYEPPSAAGNKTPYRVLGRTYHVLPTSEGYRARGIASWYGPNFHGRPTSNGEIFDMNQLTAAHKSLPLPTYARVTNRSNGRSVTVRINDRGPFKDDRIIDLSRAAAERIGMIQTGTAEVDIVALSPAAGEPAPVVVEASGIYLQLGAFGSRNNALALLQRLREEGIQDVHIQTISPSEGRFVHRVRIGPVASTDEADQLAAEVVLLGLERPRVIFE